jgi:hypothetical protein
MLIESFTALDPKRTSQFSRAALGHRSLKYSGKRPDIVCGCSGGSPLGAIATQLETCDGIGLVAPSGVQVQIGK